MKKMSQLIRAINKDKYKIYKTQPVFKQLYSL